MKNRCVILTGTVDTLGDVKRRREEYMTGIDYYGKRLKGDVYFLENSSYDFEADRDFSELLARYEIKLVKMKRERDEAKGKGYQEFSKLDRFVEKWGEAYDSFAKINGRYLVKNAEKLYDLPCDKMIIDRHRKMKVGVTGFFICDMAFYSKKIKGLYKKADDRKNYFIEHALYALLEKEKNGVAIFPENPEYEGRSGSYGGSLHRNAYKMMLRNLERKILRITGNNEFLIEY